MLWLHLALIQRWSGSERSADAEGDVLTPQGAATADVSGGTVVGIVGKFPCPEMLNYVFMFNY